MKRKILIACLGMLGLLLAVMAVAFIDFFIWRSGIIEKLETDPRRNVASTDLGEIEYAIEGEGIPMLVLHGSLGGYDSALQFGRQVDNVRIIAISRPGYLGTPLSSGTTPEKQADLFAALLDELNIDKALVFAGSSGGLSGMQFGLRHPDRTLGLMLISTGLETVEESEVPESGSIMILLTDMFMWASAKISPSLLMSTLSDSFDASDPDQAAQAKELAETLVPVRMRWEGNVNDAIQFTNPAMNDWPLSEITVPTLIVHGDRDPLASYEGALTMADRFPNARLVTIKDGGHAGFNSAQQSLFANATKEFIQSLTQISK